MRASIGMRPISSSLTCRSRWNRIHVARTSVHNIVFRPLELTPAGGILDMWPQDRAVQRQCLGRVARRCRPDKMFTRDWPVLAA